MADALDLDELARLERLATPEPWWWSYRPLKHDDWGWIRGPDGFIAARSAAGKSDNEDFEDECRACGTDPWHYNGDLIVALRNAAPALIAAARERDEARETANYWLAEYNKTGAELAALRAQLGQAEEALGEQACACIRACSYNGRPLRACREGRARIALATIRNATPTETETKG